MSMDTMMMLVIAALLIYTVAFAIGWLLSMDGQPKETDWRTTDEEDWK